MEEHAQARPTMMVPAQCPLPGEGRAALLLASCFGRAGLRKQSRPPPPSLLAHLLASPPLPSSGCAPCLLKEQVERMEAGAAHPHWQMMLTLV